MAEIDDNKKIIIGVDFGTTNTSAAIARGSCVKFLDLDPNSLTMSTAVRFKDGKEDDIIIGNMAKRFAIVKHDEVFTSFKTLMQNENWRNDSKTVKKYTLNGKTYTPTDMATKIFSRIYEVAQKSDFAKSGTIDNLLICVPAASTPYYKKEVMNAAINAGFGEKDANGNLIQDQDGRAKGISIVPEPVAASYSYGMKNGFFDPEKSKKQNIMVYDFGGGTFDVSILNVLSEKDKEPEFKLLGTFGVNNLGGDNIDEALMKIVAEQFRKETQIDLLNLDADNKGCTKAEVRAAQSKLKELAEQAKISDFAQGAPEAHFEALAIIHDNDDDVDRDLNIIVKREDFIAAIKPIMDKTFDCLKEALKESNLTLDNINRFVLVGGSTKGPWVSEAVKDFIEKEPYVADNVDVIVAEGAAYMADGTLATTQNFNNTTNTNHDSSEGEKDTTGKPINRFNNVTNLTSHFIGVEVRGGYFIPLIEKGLPFDEEHSSYSGSFKCTNPNNSGFVYITGWTTQSDVLERDDKGNAIRNEKGNLVSNYSVHYEKDGEKIFQSLGQFCLDVPCAAPHTLDITLTLTILSDNSIKLEVKVDNNEPKIINW